MLPIETPIIINAAKDLSPLEESITSAGCPFGKTATALDFDAYYIKPTILTQK
jgi:hypothetical protein